MTASKIMRMRRFGITRRRLLVFTGALVLVWLASGAVAAWKLTHRFGAVRVEVKPEWAGITVEAHRLATTDGHRIGAWLARGNPECAAVLVLHGNNSSRSASIDVMRFFAERGHGVLAISFRAHGDSSGEVNDVGYGARHDVVAAVDFLRREQPDRKVVIVAQSLGAAAAIYAAADCAGKVDGYFLESPYRDLKTAVWNRCDNYLATPFDYSAYWALRLWAPVFLPVDIDLLDTSGHVGDIPGDVPVLFLAGDEDRHARVEEVRALHARIKSHARLKSVAGCGHTQIFQNHPEVYREAMLELVEWVEKP
jgi:pimeloyl-ACP methyl ester carboxylesterase